MTINIKFVIPLILFTSASWAESIGISQTWDNSSPINYNCWQTTFSDEFNSLSLYNGSSGIWKTEYAWGKAVIANGKQYYPNPLKNRINPFNLKNGLLHIQAKPTPVAYRSRVEGMAYTSGLLTTEMSFDQLYGLFEIRAKLPSGKGLWPAFWLLPTDRKKWRSKGYRRMPEIDVLEGLGHEHATYHASLHTRTPPNSKGGFNVKHTKVNTEVSLSKKFHIYGLSWNEKELVWYFDGKVVKREATPPDSRDGARYLILNLGVGGDWPGDPDKTTRFPANYTVDWVHAYSRKGDCSS